MKLKPAFSAALVLTLLATMIFNPSARAIVMQVDGTVVPQNYTEQMQICLDRSEVTDVLDAVFDCNELPQVYLPVQDVTIHFIVQAEGAGYRNSFGWYNVGDDVSDPNNLHEIFPCRSGSSCPCSSCGTGSWRHANVDVSNHGAYSGGYIGFYLVTPETLTGGSNNDHCTIPASIPQHRIYYTEKMLNDDGDYVHYIVYTSIDFPESFYFGFEDLWRGGDNDFEDMLVFVDGLVPACIPRVEVCDGVDNDCDTVPDDLTRPCFTDCGEGIETCTGGEWGDCSARDPEPEDCDGVDDNCDGEIDEGLEQECSTICETGTEYCVMGAWVDCTAREPQDEVCNGIDDNCDGETDEGNPGGGAQCGTDVGACEFGEETCIGGGLVCTGGIEPRPEACNGIDDNCDGETDEGDPGGGETCGTDVGECETGVIHCIDGELQCEGEVGPVPETCNNLDDNCDGETDEGNPGGGAPCGISTGECEPGIETCVEGFIICVGGTDPDDELCDGLDNDCNGLIDDGDPEGGGSCGIDTGECESGIEHCIDGGIECVGETGPADEICDGLDNNCDGSVDEDDPGGGGPCGTDIGACTPGTWHCIDGELVCDEGVMPEDEICNGIDDDCDGDVDEGNPGGGELCGTDEGECEPGLTWCSSSEVEPPCDPPDPLPDPPEVLCLCAVEAVDEICDCLDNDCNELVDDGLPLGEACGTDVGECRPGYMVCIDCDWECSYDVGPSPEICDCLDNDCNGLEDDGDICEEGICYRDAASCYCALPCNPAHEFPCPSGKTCAEAEGHDGYYCISDPCADVSCEDCTQTCMDGECIDKCDRVECGDDEVCVYSGCSPMCVPRNCYAPGYECAEGKICRDGECRHDPCYGVECGDLQFCRDGECFDACTEEDACPEGRLCHDGACVEDLCWNVNCSGARVCDPETGQCEEDACNGVSCPPPHVCIDGRCTDDPCSFIACPEGFLCVGDTCVERSMLEEDVSEEADGEDVSSSPVNVTSTGGGGCAGCSVAGNGGRDGAAAWLLALSALAFLLLLAVRRKSSPTGAVTRTGTLYLALLFASLAFPVLAGAGCHMDYECLDNCDAGNGTDAAGEADLDDAADTAVDVGEDEVEDDERDVSGEETPCNPLAEEECNGMDDDCDGLIDEDFDLDIDPRNCGECGNVCHFPHAFALCNGGECVMGDCDINYYDCAADDPEDSESLGCETLCFKTRDQDDVCNNVDDDCNCLVDDLIDKTADPENCGACGEACNPRNGVGECVSPDGTEENAECVIDACSEGFWDINGEYGDGCEYECSQCEKTEGECEAGMTCCTAEGDETCNNMDDDCDNEIDEDNPGGGEPCGTDEGLCAFGTYACVDGELLCEGGVGPEDDICDGEDNNCDGEADEGDPGGGAACGTDAGECSPGVEHCVEGVIACVGETPPGPELCNGLDDDCDGIDDDGNPEGGAECGTDAGTCAYGTEKCIDGDLECEGGIGPVDEICDGLDNNCNDETDEDNPEGGDICGTSDGECETGITACIDGDLVCAGETPPSPELCNGLDDDCDGEADDGDPEGGGECGTDEGECSKGTVHCIDDSLECTGENGPVPETCDGNDNDCDGETDEGVSGEGIRCGTNRGTCEYGTTQCVDGDMECSGEVAPVTPEPCDGFDNDCDGTIDNNLAPPGISCLSLGVCFGTAPTCDGPAGYNCHYPGTYQSVETWCDGLDNNCDGFDDEGCPLLDAGDIRLDAGSANSAQIDLATDGSGVVHAVYLDRRNAYSGTYRADIYYSHSVDGGVSWLGTDIRLDTNSPGETNSMSPAIAHGQGSRVFTAWADFRLSTDYRDIYTVNSPTNGNAGTWSGSDVRIDAGSQIDSYGVDMAADASGYVYVVYEDLQADRSRHVFLARSTDSGASWDSPVQIDHNTAPAPAIAGEPHVAVDGAGGVFVSWSDNRHGNGAIYFNYSLDRGDSWQASDTRLDTDSPPGNAYSGHPRIAADSSGNVYVVWEDFRNGYSDIYVNYSNDGGANWSTADIRLDMDPLGHDSTNPVIAAGAGGMAWAAFQDLRSGLPDIYVNMTSDGGVGWLVEDRRVDTDAKGTAGSRFPAIDAVGNLVVVAWHDDRNEDVDVFMDVVMNFSLDGGAFFQPADFQVNPSSGYRDTLGVRVVAESGKAHFAWVDFRNDSHMTGDIYVRTLR